MFIFQHTKRRFLLGASRLIFWFIVHYEISSLHYEFSWEVVCMGREENNKIDWWFFFYTLSMSIPRQQRKTEINRAFLHDAHTQKPSPDKLKIHSASGNHWIFRLGITTWYQPFRNMFQTNIHTVSSTLWNLCTQLPILLKIDLVKDFEYFISNLHYDYSFHCGSYKNWCLLSLYVSFLGENPWQKTAIFKLS